MKKLIGHKGILVTNKGFSLIELLIVMTLMIIVLAITMGSFTTLLSSLKGESKVAETEVEKIVGLEILRQDIENAGYGLPWNIDTGNWNDISNSYKEADSQAVCSTTNNINNYNDASNNAPRAIVNGDNVCDDGSDYLVIKSTVVRNHTEAQKWTYLWNNGSTTIINSWGTTEENMGNNTKVIAVNPKQNVNDMVLVTYNQTFYSQLSNVLTAYSLKPSELFLLFGIGEDATLRMPFNRADYYISKSNVPGRCAEGTGVLMKAILSHSDGRLHYYSPLLDCIADFQMVFGVDITPDPDGRLDCYTNDLTTVAVNDAKNTRDRVKEVRVYILAHEGQMDRNYKYGSNIVRVGDDSGLSVCGGAGILGRDFDLTGITNYDHYRWKVYTLVILPDNLKGR